MVKVLQLHIVHRLILYHIVPMVMVVLLLRKLKQQVQRLLFSLILQVSILITAELLLVTQTVELGLDLMVVQNGEQHIHKVDGILALLVLVQIMVVKAVIPLMPVRLFMLNGVQVRRVLVILYLLGLLLIKLQEQLRFILMQMEMGHLLQKLHKTLPKQLPMHLMDGILQRLVVQNELQVAE